jgi:hypothetical protein
MRDAPTAKCGACGKTCPKPANGAAACIAGACDVVCAAGFEKKGATCVKPPCALTLTKTGDPAGSAKADGGKLVLSWPGAYSAARSLKLSMPIAGNVTTTVLAQVPTAQDVALGATGRRHQRPSTCASRGSMPWRSKS